MGLLVRRLRRAHPHDRHHDRGSVRVLVVLGHLHLRALQAGAQLPGIALRVLLQIGAAVVPLHRLVFVARQWIDGLRGIGAATASHQGSQRADQRKTKEVLAHGTG